LQASRLRSSHKMEHHFKYMKTEYDFSKGIKVKFYYPNAELNLPIYLEPEIAEFVQKLATEKDVDRSRIVNMLLKKDMEIIEI
jgi:hypothetical protein